ncbi:IS3 family transposase [Mycoplasma anserisalpingitidis]|nr:IS3 family transposase [Mycoplasma anserisalpingitidis]UCU27542.1 IS3 family transposase [Mycoplasma anserisalpingitidis]
MTFLFHKSLKMLNDEIKKFINCYNNKRIQ